MNTTNRLSYIFRKSALLRGFCVLFIVLAAVIFLIISNYKSKAEPFIESLDPPVGAPGDVIIINGKNFGDNRDLSYVEFAGNKLTASSYISWEDNRIKIILPANVQDGLVVVGVKNMVSNPSLFANEVDIPLLATNGPQSVKPLLTSLSTTKASVGDVITIYGDDFGDARNNSQVLFSANYDQKGEESASNNVKDNMICASEFDGDYEYWSNTEIRVRVPDGAGTGVVIVDTRKDLTDPYGLTVIAPSVKKSFSGKVVFLVQYKTEIENAKIADDATISLRCPMPKITSAQKQYEITEVMPSPVLENFQSCMIHQITANRNNADRMIFQQTFAVPVYETKTEVVNADKIGAYSSMSDLNFRKFTGAEENIPSDNEDIKKLAGEIVGREKNAYRRAKKVYDYMLKNFTVLENPLNKNSVPMDLLTEKQGDSFDFAVIYTALLRSLEIPCLVDSGLLVSENMECRNHWWCEFYIPNAGWIPVDVALGAGLPLPEDVWTVADAAKYYFGCLDARHILFSRGWNYTKPFAKDNKVVQFSRSFALQSVWEESAGNAEYNSYWSKPVIKGVYY